MKKNLALIVISCLLLTAISGCTPSQSPSSEVSSSPQAEESEAFPKTTTNDTTPIQGGILNVAVPFSSPWSNKFNPAYTIDGIDYQVVDWFAEGLLTMGDGLTYNQEGAATYEINQDAKTITLKMREGVKWHDGQPVTMDDLVYAYEVISHPKYDGGHYTDRFFTVPGVDDYHNGLATSISGLVLSPDKMSLEIHFTDMNPTVISGGIWNYPIPRHYYGDIPVEELAAHEKSRIKPIGFGPFKVKSIVAGELAELERFDDYWQGKPKLDGVTISLVNPDMLPAAMENGTFDVALFDAEVYADYQNPTNYQYLAEKESWFQFTGFNLGSFDGEKGISVVNPDARMADVSLRRAIGYAVNNEAIVKELYHGLRDVLKTPLTYSHSKYINTNVEGYAYNPEKAKQLLDDAGYLDVDGDGFREDKKGQPFVIIWGVPNSFSELSTQYRIQNWADIGLKVELFGGQQTEIGSFYGALMGGDHDMDMFEVGWTIDSNPLIKAMYGKQSPMNLTHYTDEKMESLIEKLYSAEAWDDEVLTQAYFDFQEYFYEVSPTIPTQSRTKLFSVNNRVNGFSTQSVWLGTTYHLIELTAAQPYKK